MTASRDPSVGLRQKGAFFQQTMHRAYMDLVKNKVNIAYGMNTSYPERSEKSMKNRFYCRIAPEVVKFMDVFQSTTVQSGWDEIYHMNVVLKAFKERYGYQFGFFSCYNFLKNKEEFGRLHRKYQTAELEGKNQASSKRKANHQEEETAKIISRDKASKNAAFESRKSSFKETSGQRNAKEMQDKAEHFPKSVAASKVVEDPSDSGDEEVQSDLGVEAFNMTADSGGANYIGKVFDELTTVIENVRSAWLSNMEAEKQLKMMASLSSSDRHDLALEYQRLQIGELRLKRRKIENGTEMPVPTANEGKSHNAAVSIISTNSSGYDKSLNKILCDMTALSGNISVFLEKIKAEQQEKLMSCLPEQARRELTLERHRLHLAEIRLKCRKLEAETGPEVAECDVRCPRLSVVDV